MPNYWYDEGGFRVRKKALLPSGAGSKNQEILYPSKFYGLEYNEETNLLSSINNVYLNGVRIAALNEEGTTAYFLTDQVDSVAHVLDEGAHTLSRMQYEPYGETLVQRGSLDFAPKYNSQELDRETNFYFYNARYYDPQIARFTSADSVIDGARSTQGWNRFSYVAGNPIKFKDPTGHNAVPKSSLSMKGNSKSTPLSRNPVPGGYCSAVDSVLKPVGKNGNFTPYNKRTPELKPGRPTKPKEMRMMPPKLKNAANDIAEGTITISKEIADLGLYIGAGFGGGSAGSPDLLFRLRGPDYVSAGVSGSLYGSNIGFSASYTLDRRGGQYYNLGAGYGQSYNWRRNGAWASMGWVTQSSEPSASDLKSAISGEAFGISGGYWFGGGFSSSGTIEFGLFTPGVGGTAGKSEVWKEPVE